jgi:hypothetical protein
MGAAAVVAVGCALARLGAAATSCGAGGGGGAAAVTADDVAGIDDGACDTAAAAAGRVDSGASAPVVYASGGAVRRRSLRRCRSTSAVQLTAATASRARAPMTPPTMAPTGAERAGGGGASETLASALLDADKVLAPVVVVAVTVTVEAAAVLVPVSGSWLLGSARKTTLMGMGSGEAKQ